MMPTMSEKNQRFTDFLIALIAFILVYLILQGVYFARSHEVKILDKQHCYQADHSNGYVIMCDYRTQYGDQLNR